MRALLLALLLPATTSVVGHAQTAAKLALANEPEIKALHAEGGLAMSGLAGAAQGQAMLDRLELRLDNEARACNFCASKQDELSELLRERVEFQEAIAHASTQTGTNASTLLEDVSAPTRWQDIKMAVNDATIYLREHCRRPANAGDEYCKGTDGDVRLAGAHENAWAKCFNQHNWVEQPSERVAYEGCMSATDPFTKLCAVGRRAVPAEQSCPSFALRYTDVDQLHFYHDRWNTDPNQLPAGVAVVPGQPVHVTLLDAVAVPATRALGAWSGTVRARLDNAVDAVFSAKLSPSTVDAANIDPGSAAGLTGRVTVLPAGTEVPIQVTVGVDGGVMANGGNLSLIIFARNLTETKEGELFAGGPTRHITGWPAAGTVLIPAGTALSFATSCGCPYSMSVAEFRKRAAANAAAAATAPPVTYASRPILLNSRLQVVLLETIDVPSIQAGKLSYRGRLNADMELPSGVPRTDAVKLPSGTDVYLKVVDQDAGQMGHIAKVSVDYVVLDGQHVSLATAELRDNFFMPGQLTQTSRTPPPVHVVWPAGTAKWLVVVEQAEVSGQTLQAQAGPPQAGAVQQPSASSPVAASPKTETSDAPAPRASVLNQRYTINAARFNKDIDGLGQFAARTGTRLPAEMIAARSRVQNMEGAYLNAIRRGDYDQAEQALQNAEAAAPEIENFLNK